MFLELLQIPEFASLLELLQWLAFGGGAVIVVGMFVTRFLENLAFWHNLPHYVKVFVPIALVAIVSAFAEYAIVADLLAFIPDWVETLFLTLLGWLTTQKVLEGLNSRGYASSAKARARGG